MEAGTSDDPGKQDSGKRRSRLLRLLKGAISVVVLGGFFTVSFGDEISGHLQRYRFFSLEASASWMHRPSYRLYEEFEFTDERSQSRRLFIFEGNDGDRTQTRIVLTDDHYRLLNSTDFAAPGAHYKTALIQQVSPPTLELLTASKPRTTCLRFQIIRDQIVSWEVGESADLAEIAYHANLPG